MAAASSKADASEASFEKAAEALWNAEFLLVVAGPLFDEFRSPFTSEFCDQALLAKPNKFMGFWGGFYNEFVDRIPHDGFAILARWRDRMFCHDDVRKKKGNKRTDEDGEAEMMARCNIYTNNIDNLFQKAGFPAEEVFEVCGNITVWQCSRKPPCCSRVWSLDRAFRFNIDETNHEALPIKYVVDRREKERVPAFVTVDIDDEELAALAKDDQPVGTDPRSVKDAVRRSHRRSCRALVIRWSPRLQIGADRFHDLFEGFATVVGGSIGAPVSFPPEALQQQTLGATESDDASVVLAGDATSAVATGSEAPLQPRPPPQVSAPVATCKPPSRVSHLLAHVDVADRGMFSERRGRTYVAERERWQRDRELQYQAVSKFFQADVHGVAAKRAKYIAYNISVVFTSAALHATSQHHQPMLTQSESLLRGGHSLPAESVLPTALRERLFSVYRPGEEAKLHDAIDALHAEIHGQWTQGWRGCFYFSNMRSGQTMQEPINHKYHDVVDIPFPVDDAGQPTVRMPGPGGLVSVVCETVVREDAMAEGGATLGADDNPYTYTRNVWQLAGVISPAEFRDQSEFKDKENVEHVLESGQRHVVKIGVRKSSPWHISYLQLEIPCDETDPAASSSIVSTVVSKKEPAPVRVEGTRREERTGQRPPVPAPNHQLCCHCHDLGRPFVLMSRPGRKDDGFCQAAMAARTKAYKAWEKGMLDALKRDANKSLVLLEVGCDRKLDAARSYSEKTFKSLKGAKCTFVRISPVDLETKKKKGGAAQDAGNYIAIQGAVLPTLAAIDRQLAEKMRKKGN